MSSANSFTAPTRIPHGGVRAAVLSGIVATEIMILCFPAIWWLVAGLFLLVMVAVFGLLVAVLRGRGEVVVLFWVLTFPLGYYFLSFPKEGALFTLDRFFVGTLLVTACFVSRRNFPRLPQALRRSGAYWAVFLLFAGLGIPRVATPLSSLRIWLDALLLPALLAWYIVLHFDVRRCLSTLHAVTCLMSMYVAAIGFMEVIIQRDLLPLPGGGVIVAGDSTDITADFLVRPNGPFGASNSFAMVGIVSFFFLLFLRRALAGQMPTWQRVLHRIGVSAALLDALLPLFRSVLVSFVIVLLVDIFYQSGWRRTLRLVTIGSMCLGFLSIRILLPSVFEERTGSATWQARLAQQKQTLALFLDHPINGVGLSNVNAMLDNDKYTTYYEDAEALGSAHNNLGAILSETGLTGLVPFVVSQALIVLAFWKTYQVNSYESRLAWKTFLFLFMAFSINGMSLTIIYSGDANMWYMCVIAVIYKFALTSPDHIAIERLVVAERPV